MSAKTHALWIGSVPSDVDAPVPLQRAWVPLPAQALESSCLLTETMGGSDGSANRVPVTQVGDADSGFGMAQFLSL